MRCGEQFPFGVVEVALGEQGPTPETTASHDVLVARRLLGGCQALVGVGQRLGWLTAIEPELAVTGEAVHRPPPAQPLLARLRIAGDPFRSRELLFGLVWSAQRDEVVAQV